MSTEIQLDSQQTATVRVDELITGRVIQHPIHDSKGILLLAAGSVISVTVKQQLKARNIVHVEMHADDIAAATLSIDIIDADGNYAALDEALVNRLDEVIESGSLFVANSGPAVKDGLVLNGCNAYDPKQRDKLLEKHRETSKKLDGMIHVALHGKHVDGSQMVELTSDYLGAMVSDRDAVLSVASEVVQDAQIADHCLQMALLGMSIGIEMNLDDENVRTIGLCGLVHDWGMSRVPADLRNAQRILTSDEMAVIKKHPIYSLEMLLHVKGIPSIVPLICYQVHERPNQTGYPRGRSASMTHLFARILNVADTFIALTSKRPYRDALIPYEAMKCMLQMVKRKDVDADAMRHLLHVVSLFPIGSYLVLSDGSVARTIRSNGEDYSHPIVQRITDPQGKRLTGDAVTIDLSDSELSVAHALPTPGASQISLTENLLSLSDR